MRRSRWCRIAFILYHEHGVAIKSGIEPDKIEERQRAHGMVQAQLDARVNVLAARQPVLVNANGVQEVGDEQAIDDKAGRVLAVTIVLPREAPNSARSASSRRWSGWCGRTR
jgi:hypothetical protein